MDFIIIDLNNTNLDDHDFDNDDPETIIHVRLMTVLDRYKQRKACKKDQEKINASRMASNKIMGLVHVRR